MHDPSIRRFTYVKDSSRKFWEIHAPKQINNTWSVQVHFGRIGTAGQYHTKLFTGKSRWYADKFYNGKIAEKLAKGYSEAGFPSVKKNVVSYVPDYVPVKPKPCQHDNLTRKGSSWTCNACGNKVEFDKTVEVKFGVESEARRFFDLEYSA